MSKKTLSWLMLVLLAGIWGSSFILMKRGMETPDEQPIFSDVQVGALRMFIAGLVMLPFGLMSLKLITSRKQVLSLLVVGFSGNFIPAFLFTFAETQLSSGLAGMLNSLTPIFTLIIGTLIFRQQLRARQTFGLLLAFAGITLLVVVSSSFASKGEWYHIGALVLATFCYGLSLNTIKHTLSGFRSWQITALAFSFVLIPASLAVFFSDTTTTIMNNPHAFEGLGYITILSVVGTCLALVIFNRLIALNSAIFASSVTYLIPFVAVILGVFGNGEQLHWAQPLAMCIVLSGVYLANKSTNSSLSVQNKKGQD